MKAVFTHRFLRVFLLAAAMVTAYLLGRAWGMARAQTAVNKEAQSRLAQTKKAHSSLEMAAIKNLPPEERNLLSFNKVKLGRNSLGMDNRGNFFIDGEDLSILAKIDPQQGLALLAKLPQGKLTEDAYRNFFKQWLEARPEDTAEIAAAAAGLPQGPAKIGAVSGLAVAWAKTDPTAALDWISTLDNSNASAFKSTLTFVSVSNPALAAHYVEKFPNADDRNEIIFKIVQSWGYANWSQQEKTDTVATLAWLDQVTAGATYEQAVKGIFWSYGYMQPAEGVALVDQLTDPKDRSMAIATLSIDWSVSHPAESLNWLQTLPDSDSVAREAAIKAAFTLWSKKNPEAASEYISGADPALYFKLAPTLAPELAKQDPQAALNWLNTFPDGEVKTQAVSSVLATLAAANFDSAWNYATALPAGADRDGAVDSVISSLSKTSPAQAAALLDQLGGAAALSAVNSVAANWANADPGALSQWIRTQPAGAVRDAAVAQFVTARAMKDPAAAFAMANTMTNDSARKTQVVNSLLAMAQQDLPAATQAAKSANLTENTKQSLLIYLAQATGR